MMESNIVNNIRACIIEIATPFNTGTGFYLREYDIIITNEHVIRDNGEVIIKGDGLKSRCLPCC